MSARAAWDVVQLYKPVELEKLAPHDLRRTFARLAFEAGSPMAQIQRSLGHESIQTTEIYIAAEQDFQDAPSDRIQFKER